MKLICEGLDLSEAVLKVIKAAAVKSPNPILECIKLKAEEDSLTLSATDLALSIEKKISADVKIEGEVVVPGRVFSEFVKKLSNDQIELSLTDDNRLKISYTDSEGFFQCLNKDEFPHLKKIDSSEYFDILNNDLKEIINKTIFSVAMDDARPILKGSLFEIINRTLTVVSLDGYRLALATKPLVENSADFSFVIPGKSLLEISRILEPNDETIRVYIQKNYIMIDLGTTKVITRLLDGDFINYKQVIPTSVTTTITINKDQLEEGIERASLLARMDKNNLVKFEIKDSLLTLTSNSEVGNITENITVALEGKEITIAFNARYFSECLRNISDEFVKINFSSPIAPCTISSSEDKDYLYLILPVRILK